MVLSRNFDHLWVRNLKPILDLHSDRKCNYFLFLRLSDVNVSLFGATLGFTPGNHLEARRPAGKKATSALVVTGVSMASSFFWDGDDWQRSPGEKTVCSCVFYDEYFRTPERSNRGHFLLARTLQVNKDRVHQQMGRLHV